MQLGAWHGMGGLTAAALTTAAAAGATGSRLAHQPTAALQQHMADTTQAPRVPYRSILESARGAVRHRSTQRGDPRAPDTHRATLQTHDIYRREQ